MKQKTVFFILLFIALSISAAKPSNTETKYSEVSVTDALSGTVFKFPEGCKQDSSDVNFEKAMLFTPKTVVSVYSMPHPDDKTFTWKRINEFDANNKYGTLIKKTKLDNVDGWIRYYNSTDKQGRQVISCVTLIRGNAYALYLLETAYEVADCVTPAIVASTEFKNIGGRRIENDGSLTLTFWIVTLITVLLSGVGKLIFGREPSAGIAIMGVITVIAYALGLFFWLHYGIGTTILWLVLTSCVWIGVITASTWTEFFNFLQKALDKMGG